jgi:hypothetical protein
MDSGLRWAFAGTGATAFFTFLALAFPNMSRLLTIPGALLSLGVTIGFLWPEIKAFYAHPRYRTGALVGMLVCAVGFIGFCAWNWWPPKVAEPPMVSPPPKEDGGKAEASAIGTAHLLFYPGMYTVTILSKTEHIKDITIDTTEFLLSHKTIITTDFDYPAGPFDVTIYRNLPIMLGLNTDRTEDVPIQIEHNYSDRVAVSLLPSMQSNSILSMDLHISFYKKYK